MSLRKEATARIKINRLLEAAGWRFYDDKNGPANVVLEPNVILRNGNIHYLWDLEQGNPTVITAFPGPDEIKNHYAFEPNAERLFAEKVERDFIALTQMPGYASEAAWGRGCGIR